MFQQSSPVSVVNPHGARRGRETLPKLLSPKEMIQKQTVGVLTVIRAWFHHHPQLLQPQARDSRYKNGRIVLFPADLEERFTSVGFQLESAVKTLGYRLQADDFALLYWLKAGSVISQTFKAISPLRSPTLSAAKGLPLRATRHWLSNTR